MASRETTMKILQLNAWSNRLDLRVVKLITEENPDVICIQEMFSSPYELGFFIPFEELMKQIDYLYHYYSPLYSIAFMSGQVKFGNLILSKLPLENPSTVFTNLEYIDNFDFNLQDYNVRNFQHVIVESEGKKINIINHHGYHIHEHKQGDEHTLKAVHQIKDFVDTLEGPIVLAGDFNLAPTSPSIQVLDESLRNLSTEYGLLTTRNDLTSKSEVCDYIFVSNDLTINDFHMSAIEASDHNGLIADVS
jgi:endonuclease/exonuclease/phosphatase family metal-dependent hydrolase